MDVLHMHWLFLTSVVSVTNKESFWVVNDTAVTVASHSSGLFFTSWFFSILSVSLWPLLSPFITKVLFIVAPVFSHSVSLFPLSVRTWTTVSLTILCLITGGLSCSFFYIMMQIDAENNWCRQLSHTKSVICLLIYLISHARCSHVIISLLVGPNRNSSATIGCIAIKSSTFIICRGGILLILSVPRPSLCPSRFNIYLGHRGNYQMVDKSITALFPVICPDFGLYQLLRNICLLNAAVGQLSIELKVTIKQIQVMFLCRFITPFTLNVLHVHSCPGHDQVFSVSQSCVAHVNTISRFCQLDCCSRNHLNTLYKFLTNLCNICGCSFNSCYVAACQE